MRLTWLTDLHFNMVDVYTRKQLYKEIKESKCSAILITGDINTSSRVYLTLEEIQKETGKKIYFVLGNHDYYGSSIYSLNATLKESLSLSKRIVWLSDSGVIELNKKTCLIGHEGLADGLLGNAQASTVMLNDYFHIKEFKDLKKDDRLKVQEELGKKSAKYLKEQLKVALGKYSKIIVALHVPPFAEACWHEGKNTDDFFLPHFGCKSTGVVLKEYMEQYPDKEMLVLCGHTHSDGVAIILPNLKVINAGASYCYPKISKTINIK